MLRESTNPDLLVQIGKLCYSKEKFEDCIECNLKLKEKVL